MAIKAITHVQYPFKDDRNIIQEEYLPVNTMEDAIDSILKEYDNSTLHVVETAYDYTILAGHLLTGWQPGILIVLYEEI